MTERRSKRKLEEEVVAAVNKGAKETKAKVSKIEKSAKAAGTAVAKDTKAAIGKVSKNVRADIEAVEQDLGINLTPDDIASHIFPKTPWSSVAQNDLLPCYNVADVTKAVNDARKNKKRIRVAGAQHSVPGAVFTRVKDDNKVVVDEVALKLQFRDITWPNGEGNRRCRVGAGCNMGVDPSDPHSTKENSFFRVISEKGFALPITGGISHQTVGGFMCTGSAGGSLQFTFADNLVACEFVDGMGQYQRVEKGTDEYLAAAVSFGLFGVMCYYEFDLADLFLVEGTEKTVKYADSSLVTGQSYKEHLQSKEYPYYHTVWFGQDGVKSVLDYRAKQVSPTIPDPDDPSKQIPRKISPYEAVLAKPAMNYLAAGAISMVDLAYQHPEQKMNDAVAAMFLNVMNPPSKHDNVFTDHWYLALPNDDQMLVDSAMRIQFTEIWVDVSEADDVIKELSALFYKKAGAAGSIGVEMYGAKASPFWMSASYGRDVLRVDPYWWEYNRHSDRINDYYDPFWKILLAYPSARIHFAKHAPPFGSKITQKDGTELTVGPEYIKARFPMYEQWMAMRTKYDPQQVFVSKYWRDFLGIPALKK